MPKMPRQNVGTQDTQELLDLLKCTKVKEEAALKFAHQFPGLQEKKVFTRLG